MSSHHPTMGFRSCAVCAVVDARLSSALRAPSCLRYEVYICSGDDGDDGNSVSYSRIPPIHGRERTSSDGRYDINFAKIYALRSLSIVSERTDSNDRTDCFALFLFVYWFYFYTIRQNTTFPHPIIPKYPLIVSIHTRNCFIYRNLGCFPRLCLKCFFGYFLSTPLTPHMSKIYALFSPSSS